MLTIRRFEEADARACCDVINACIPSLGGLNDAARALVMAKNVPDVLQTELGRFFTLVAVTANGVAAVGALDGQEIKRLYVHPRAQRRGLGKILLRELEAEARRTGSRHLEISASPSSISFYAAAGFRASDPVINMVGAAEFRHVTMTKDLS
jgi:GNAT superfamily N-acetyltransferase